MDELGEGFEWKLCLNHSPCNERFCMKFILFSIIRTLRLTEVLGPPPRNQNAPLDVEIARYG